MNPQKGCVHMSALQWQDCITLLRCMDLVTAHTVLLRVGLSSCTMLQRMQWGEACVMQRLNDKVVHCICQGLCEARVQDLQGEG